MTTNNERVKRYKERMKAAGFRRLDAWVTPELFARLERERQSWECYGRVLERLLLGESVARPITGKYATPEK